MRKKIQGIFSGKSLLVNTIEKVILWVVEYFATPKNIAKGMYRSTCASTILYIFKKIVK